MCRSDGLDVGGIGAQGSERSSVDNTFHLDDQGVEDVDVEMVAHVQRGKVTLKQPDDSFPYAAVVWRICRYKIPLQSFASQLDG